MNYWIFQGNPKYFNVEAYIMDRKLIWWTVRQKSCLNLIKSGDKVCIWQSAGGSLKSGGIIAYGDVVSEVVRRTDEESKEYWKTDAWKTRGEAVQIQLSDSNIHNVLLSREVLKSDEVLSKLSVITIPQQTNYAITKSQYKAILNLWRRGKNETPGVELPPDIDYPLMLDSWTVYSDHLFVKLMDKSTFINKGSGIPKGMQHFWEAESLLKGKQLDLTANYKGEAFSMRIVREMHDNERLRIFWHSDFERVISRRYPDIYSAIKSGSEIPSRPKMRFVKLDALNYEVSFFDAAVVANDIKVDDEESPQFALTSKEGAERTSFGKRYERDPKMRESAILIHGTTCKACDFNFEEIYGSRGEGYIEIHHIKPLYIEGIEIQVNSETDLVPVCSNCHRMIHRDKHNVLSVSELRSLLKK